MGHVRADGEEAGLRQGQSDRWPDLVEEPGHRVGVRSVTIPSHEGQALPLIEAADLPYDILDEWDEVDLRPWCRRLEDLPLCARHDDGRVRHASNVHLEFTRGRCPEHRSTVPVQLCRPLLTEEVQVVRQIDDRGPIAVSQDGVQVLGSGGDPGQENGSESPSVGLKQPGDD